MDDLQPILAVILVLSLLGACWSFCGGGDCFIFGISSRSGIWQTDGERGGN